MSVAVAGLLLLFTATGVGQNRDSRNHDTPNPDDGCQRATLEGRVQGGQQFTRSLGNGLVFNLNPEMNNWGWLVVISPENSDEDWAYPVNPPLRSDNAQYMATGYGDFVKDQLKRPHAIRFVLTRSDYSSISKLVDEALWPNTAKKPEKAADIYFAALDHIQTGTAVVTALDYDKSGAPETVGWMRFGAVVIVPKAFHGDSHLDWTLGSCDLRQFLKQTPNTTH